MAHFPKTLTIRGIPIEVHDFEELDEFLERYGVDAPITLVGDLAPAAGPRPRHARVNGLSHADQSLLQQFVENGPKGVRSSDITQAIGAKGRGIPIALDAWSRRIGLVTADNVTAFEPMKRLDGRGFRLTGVYINAGRSMLGGDQR